MNILGGAITLILAFSVFLFPRRQAVIAIFCAVCFITQGQQLDLGLHFTAIRLVLLAAIIRVAVRGDLSKIRFNSVDKAIILYALAINIIATIREGTSDEMIYRFGSIYNILLAYFVFRSLIADSSDIKAVLNMLVPVFVLFAALLVAESITNHNLFSVLGGVHEFSMSRDGHVRSQGAFRSPITAGSLGATFVMLYVGVIFTYGWGRLAAIGLTASSVILICSHSSGPLLGMVIGLVSLALWRFRRNMRTFRWGISITLIGLHLIMKAPVWALLGRVSDLVGGGGYYRSELIDHFVNSFSSWWLAGTGSTGGWMATQLSDGHADLTNQFVADGLNAGLIGFFVGIFLFVRCFQAVGRTIRSYSDHDINAEKMAWSLGATLMGTVAIFISVTYFDQMNAVEYFIMACIASSVPTDTTITLDESYVAARDLLLSTRSPEYQK